MFGLLAPRLPSNRSLQTFWLWIVSTVWPAPTCVNIHCSAKMKAEMTSAVFSIPTTCLDLWNQNLNILHLSVQNRLKRGIFKAAFFHFMQQYEASPLVRGDAVMSDAGLQCRETFYRTLFDMITEDTIKMQIQYIIENDLFFKRIIFSKAVGRPELSFLQ